MNLLASLLNKSVKYYMVQKPILKLYLQTINYIYNIEFPTG